MYYLKYRPQLLSQIDNIERRATLTSIFSAKQVPHAFLFVGPKGTGKTSTARIVAKILNCEKRSHPQKGETLSIEPCNQCDNCQAITKNRFLDVYELDAASNRGIDDVRALREQVNYAPARGKYKVYIIDEVHMLTKEAYNALLKTLEEPPPFVVFILATTEAHKLPDTVVSRCLTLHFGKATGVELRRSLERIVKGEQLSIKAKTLELIAAKSAGSFRDAAKLLELVVASTNQSHDQVTQLFKQQLKLDPQILLSTILSKKSTEALKFIEEFDQQGGSFSFLIEDLLERLRQTLLSKRALLNDAEALTMVKKVTLKEISKLIKLLLESYQLQKYSPTPVLPLMLAVVEYCEAA